VLTSPSCTERDLLVKSFLETGAKKDEAAFYVTINPGLAKALAYEYPSSFWLFVCNPQADAIVKNAPNIVKLKGVENLTDISIVLTSAVRKLDPSLRGDRRICLGLVSDVLLQHHAVQTRRWLAGLIPELQSQGFTVLAIMDPEMHPSQEARAILDLFDGEISILEKEGERDGGKYLKINKMSNQRYLEDELPLKRKEPEVKPQDSTVGQTVLDKHRIAVLPFVNMSPDPNDEYFADGMTEEIISTVSGISGLDVISRTSIMRYKKTEKTMKEIGRELEVGSVLEGSLRKAENRIRVTTQLIDVMADRHLWAQNYDRTLDDVFAVQSDVAKHVAEALRVRILSSEKERIEKKPTESTAAYTLYLKGRFAWSKRGIRYNEEARECFKQAVKEDPKFALGYVGQADCCLVLRNNWGIDREANLERAKSLVADALELDAELAEAHATKGLIQWEEYRLGPAEEEFKKAIELKPSYATAHQWYFALLVSQLRWGEALEQIERAVELDPFSPIINLNHGYYYFFRRAYRKALELYKRVATLDPELKALDLSFAGAPSGMADAFGKLKMFEEMKREFANFANLLQGTYPLIKTRVDARIAYFEGDREGLRRILPELEAHLNETGSNAYSVACLYFFLGEKDKGFEWLEKSYSRKEDTLLYVKWDWDLDGVREDPRYLDLLKRLGLG
jgi:TolB-like protein